MFRTNLFAITGLPITAALVAAMSPAFGQVTETVVANLTPAYGTNPTSRLAIGSHGILYGTASEGGTGASPGYGTVFQLSPPARGQTSWKTKAIYAFDGAAHGATPYGGLLAGRNGVLYGTTVSGGASNEGIVFELLPPAIGKQPWKEIVLYSFGSQAGDGANPRSDLIADEKGALYGTTYSLGAAADAGGTVFKLMPPSGGQHGWKEVVLYSFGSQPGDGINPIAGISRDATGVLYGTTYNGGAVNKGTVYKLTPPGAGEKAWTETVLHSFGSGTDGANPSAGLVADKAGVLYGDTRNGGAGGGTVFALSPPSLGQTNWTETLLVSKICCGPYGSLLESANGVLFGTTEGGGPYNGGTVFKLTPPAQSQTSWTFATLYSFETKSSDAQFPTGALVGTRKGYVYGASSAGGSDRTCSQGCGTVFQLTGSGFIP